jgi:hypothetical protein
METFGVLNTTGNSLGNGMVEPTVNSVDTFYIIFITAYIGEIQDKQARHL